MVKFMIRLKALLHVLEDLYHGNRQLIEKKVLAE